MSLFKITKYYSGPKSDHFDGIRFFNPWNPYKHSFWKVLYWKLTSSPRPWPDRLENTFSDIPPARVTGNALRVSFVGHSTVLIQTQGINILTDPTWSEWAAPFAWSRIRRVSEPGISFENLPKIDIVLISHNHYDHLHLETLQKLHRRDNPQFITPLGNDAIIHAYDSSIPIAVLDWGQSLGLTSNISVHLVPAQHWSARGLFDRRKALWGGFVIETDDGNIYFSGDTGYGKGEVFKHVKERFRRFRLAILPIGAYKPRFFMKDSHMNPADAIKAYHDLGLPHTMGVHYGTFRLADEGYDCPIKDLSYAKTTHNITQDRFRVLSIGEAWNVPM